MWTSILLIYVHMLGHLSDDISLFHLSSPFPSSPIYYILFDVQITHRSCLNHLKTHVFPLFFAWFSPAFLAPRPDTGVGRLTRRIGPSRARASRRRWSLPWRRTTRRLAWNRWKCVFFLGVLCVFWIFWVGKENKVWIKIEILETWIWIYIYIMIYIIFGVWIYIYIQDLFHNLYMIIIYTFYISLYLSNICKYDQISTLWAWRILNAYFPSQRCPEYQEGCPPQEGWPLGHAPQSGQRNQDVGPGTWKTPWNQCWWLDFIDFMPVKLPVMLHAYT